MTKTMPQPPDHRPSLEYAESGDSDLSPLLSEPFAQAWAAPAPTTGLAERLTERLNERLQRSLAAEQGMVTVRRRRNAAELLTEGVQRHWLYRAAAERPLRPGEPRAVSILALQAGASLTLPAGGAHEFLILHGSAEVDGEPLGLRDFLLLPAGVAVRLWSRDGARVVVREADNGARERTLVRDAEAGWPEFAPGIRRRVLWSSAGHAALLYQTDPGASVPLHSHGHDEECLMVQGELFVDDVLLQAGDYQLAPAGTGHHITETGTGGILYAHGDLDLRFT